MGDVLLAGQRMEQDAGEWFMKYPKPTRFSDPYHDWSGCEEQLAEILGKSDNQLTTEDYRPIFSKNLPAANYEEGAYYIEKCGAHIANGKEVHESRFPEGYLWWLNHYWDKIVEDGLDAKIKELVVSSFFSLLDVFELFDLTEEECAKLGRDFNYSIGPYNQGTVHDFFDELTIYDPFESELERILRRLMDSDDMAHIRWYIEITSHTRGWALTYNKEFADLDNYERKQAVFNRMNSIPLVSRKYEATLELMMTEAKPKYYRMVNLFR